MSEEKNPVDTARKWANELKQAKREDEKFIRRAKKIVKRYRDERTTNYDGNRRYNLLWSNVQTLFPALYAKTPRSQVERRWKDQDPIGRCASTIIERALDFEIEHYGDFDNAMKMVVTDRLLPGRGVAWVRFERKEVELPNNQEGHDEEEYASKLTDVTDATLGAQAIESTPVDYVYWEDFRCTPARTWDEVTWVARRVYMGKAEIKGRFGDEVANNVPYTHEPLGIEEMRKSGASEYDVSDMKKAQVWEIWCKTSEYVYWIAEGYDRLLDSKPDPYGLDNFFPCPKPLFATQTTDTLVPVPDYALYQDQAEEIDSLTQRIALLVDAVKVVGVYDASQPSIQRMLTEGVDNVLIPVDTWAAFSEKGGIKGTVDFMPLDMVIGALNECYKAREAAKQVVYDVTGLSDIIRGSSMASETATAQQIKGQYASMRLKKMQHDVARFASDLLRIKAQMMCELYSPETLVNMSGVQGSQDGQFIPQAIQLIKNEVLRNFRIEVASDTLIEMDEASEKQSRIEFLSAFGSALQAALPVAQAAPEMRPVIMEALQFVVRTYKGGRQLETSLEQAAQQMEQPKPQQPSPEMIQAQQQSQLEQMRMQAEQQKAAMSQQVEQQKLQAQQEIEQFKAQTAMQLEQMKQAAETERAQFKAQLEAQTKLEIAQMQTDASSKPQNMFQVDSGGKLDNIADTITQHAMQQGEGIAQAVNNLAQVADVLVGAVEEIKRPKKRILQRDANGKAIGAIEVMDE